jgi:molecular chaperone GrpE
MAQHKKDHKNEQKRDNEKTAAQFPDQPAPAASADPSLSPWTSEPAAAATPNAKAAGPPSAESIVSAELAELKKKASERDEYLDLLQRTRAEYLNYIKRAQKDRAETIKYGIQEFAKRVVAVIDDFSRAIASAEKTKDLEKFFEGVKLIQAQFEKVLSEADITPIETVDKPFDPSKHEAVTMEENATVPEGTVLEELQRGFMLNDRALRPARVKIARKPAAPAEPKPPTETPKEDEKK